MILKNVQYMGVTLALMALIFVILYFVGRKQNKAFAADPEKMLAGRKIKPHDIVLLPDGRRVTITEVLDDGASFLAETLVDFGRRPDRVTLTQKDIVKIEYYS